MLVVGSAEIELVVYELIWLNNAEEDLENDEESKENIKKKMKFTSEPLVGSELIEEDSDQGNVCISFFIYSIITPFFS